MQTTTHCSTTHFSIILIVAGLAALLALPTEQAQAQTPVTKIENSAGDSVFTVFDDGSLLGLGGENTGVIPVEGAGTRMMWYPAKAAFRAGGVGETSGTEVFWDADSVGTHSVAFGRDTRASGADATSMGYRTAATENQSTAMGYRTTASGNAATAMGRFSTASGNYSSAMGYSTTASGNYSTAMGRGTTASGYNSTAMGINTIASGSRSTALGDNTIAVQEASLSVGEYNSANSSADGTLFVVGNGVNGSRTDALVVDDTGNLTIGGTLTESSDRRLKKEITPLKNGVLGELSKITPSKFQFKNQQTHPSGSQVGLIAQEVQQQFPELVSEASNGYLSVSYSKFTAVLLKGLQEQQQKIENQQTTIDQLEKKTRHIAALEKQVSKIKQNRQMAGLPVSAIGILLLGMAIGGGLWWQSRNDEGK